MPPKQSKQRSRQHTIDSDGEKLLRSQLPSHWVLREYRPDYGLDFVLELFQGLRPNNKGTHTYETLGEHIFIQLKSEEVATRHHLKLYGRNNVEKTREVLDRHELVGEVETIPFSLETSELVTVERMGAGVPVLLVIADLSRKHCAFVCLNDYLDKILIPRHGDYQAKEHRTIHVPIHNEVESDVGVTALRWYGRRAKLLAAFQRFTFQAAEVLSLVDRNNWRTRARYFASRLMAYDFWDDTEMWAPIGLSRDDLESLLREMDEDRNASAMDTNPSEEEALLERALRLWRQLGTLPRLHEDVCREWFLPTALGYLTTLTVGDAASAAPHSTPSGSE